MFEQTRQRFKCNEQESMHKKEQGMHNAVRTEKWHMQEKRNNNGPQQNHEENAANTMATME